MHLHMIHRPWDFVILANLHVGQFHGLPKSSFSNEKKTHTFGGKLRRYCGPNKRRHRTKPLPPTAIRWSLPCKCPFFKGNLCTQPCAPRLVQKQSHVLLVDCWGVQSCEQWLDVICDPSHGSQSDPLCLKFAGNKETMSQPFWIFWIDQRCPKFKAFACTCFDRNLLWYIPKWQGNHFSILRLPSCRFISQCSWMTASHKRLTLNTPKCYPVRTPDIKQEIHPGWKFRVNLLFYMKLLDLTYRYQGVDVTIFNANCMPQGLVSTSKRLSTAQVGMNFWSNDHGDRILKVNNSATTLLVVGHGTLHSYTNLVQLSGSLSVIEIDIYVAIKDDNCTSCALCLTRFV